ncbi:unnamed protein product [Prunus brigantina]
MTNMNHLIKLRLVNTRDWSNVPISTVLSLTSVS